MEYQLTSFSEKKYDAKYNIRGTKLDSCRMPKNEKTISEEKSIQTRIHTRIKKSKDVFNGSKDINAV